MKKGTPRLEELIETEIVLGEKLLALLSSKKDAIVANDVELIQDIVRQENEALHEVEECGLDRQDQVLTISKEKPYRITERLGDFIEQVEDPGVQERLKTQRQALMELYKSIAEASKLNGELLAQSMKITQQIFSRLSSVDRKSKNANYHPRKGKGGSYSTPTLNSKG